MPGWRPTDRRLAAGQGGQDRVLAGCREGALAEGRCGQGRRELPSGLFAEADRRLFEAQSAENKWPAKWDVRVYSDQEEFRGGEGGR